MKLKLFETFGQMVAKLRASSSVRLDLPPNTFTYRADELDLKTLLPDELGKPDVELRAKVEEL